MKPVRILLISANRTSINMPVFPLGLAYLGASLRKEGHEVEVLDLLDDEAPETAIVNAIQVLKPQLIGLSVRNVDNQDPRNPEFFLPGIRSIIRTCRQASAAPVVVGGAGYSIFPHAALDFLQGDYGVVGEGERALSRMARAIEAGGAIADIPGVVRRGCRQSPRRSLTRSLDRIPSPARELLDVHSYSAAGPMPVQGKRGCHLKCIYCSSPLIEGRAVRVRSPASIIREIESATERHGIDSFFFVDNLFNYPEDHAIALCEAIAARGPRITWRAIINPLWVTHRLVRLMKKAGCTEVSLGFESGSDRMLRRLGKGFGVDDVRRASRLFREFEISQTGFLLLGGPGEDRASVDASFSLAEALCPEALKLAVGVRIYPGTAMARLAAKEAVVAPDADLLAPVFYMSEAARDWLPERAQHEVRSHPGWRL
jgi:radical SAM superfamily enzyme YgiQ (UPF0313 family)